MNIMSELSNVSRGETSVCAVPSEDTNQAAPDLTLGKRLVDWAKTAGVDIQAIHIIKESCGLDPLGGVLMAEKLHLLRTRAKIRNTRP